ncbi:MAG: sigma-70 family RNA polymerase sigma factor [Candidatus Zixiibacteriota bacterium]
MSDPEEWVDRHGDALYRYALRYIRDRSTAEDLVQETLLAALKGRAAFAGASSERTWLIGILKNKVVDHYRRAGREERLMEPEQFSDSDETDYISTGPDAGMWQPRRRPVEWSVDPNDPVEKQQFWDHLQRCLEGLEAGLAKVYALRDLEEIEYQEVCNVLAITPTNLRVMLHRARKLLRQCLEANWIGI